MGNPIRIGVSIVLALALLASAAAAQTFTEVVYEDDFQSYGTQANPAGWVDTSVGNPRPEAEGLYKTWPDPLEGNRGTNVVYGTKQGSGRPEGNNPRIGTFSTLTTHSFSASGRFEYRGRFIRTDDDTRIGLTFLSSYPETDSYYLIGLWSVPGEKNLTMQLFGFGAGALNGTTDSDFTPARDTWYRFLIRVDDRAGETRISARFWAEDGEEPETFSIEAADASPSRLKEGRIGIWSAVKGAAYVDDIAAKSPVDHTPPEIKFFESGAELAHDSTTAYGRDAIVDVKATDDITGVASLEATLDGAPYTALTPIAAEGLHTIHARAADHVGNASEAQIQVMVDKTPPVVTILEGESPFPAGFWFNRDVVPHATIVDATATTTTATLNGQPYQLGTAIVAEGTYALTVSVTDAVGWTTNAGPIAFTIDKTPPALTIAEPAAGSTLTTPRAIVSGGSDDAVTVSVNGVAATIDDAAKRYTTSATVNLLEGENTITATGVDRAGNVGTTSSKVRLDTRAPELTVTSPEANACLNVSELQIAGTAADASLARVSVSAGGEPVNATIASDGRTFSGVLPVTSDGKVVIRVEAVDASGHSSTATIPLTIDRIRPLVSLTESGAPFTAALVNRAVSLHVRATDADSAAVVTATLDGQPYVNGTAIDAEKAYELRATAKDCAGNVSEEFVHRFTIDRTAPRIVSTAPVSGATIGTKSAIAGVLSENATVVAEGRNVSASVSGVNFTFTDLLAEGANDFVFVATDSAGNESRTPFSLIVDTTAPSLEITENGTAIPPNALYNRAVTPVIRSNDPAATITATSNGQPFTSGTTISADGNYAIDAAAKDSVGNQSATASATFRIDRTAPSIAITSPANAAVINADSVEVRGTISGDDVARVTVNGAVATLAGGTFTATVPLDLGLNAIAAIAFDNAGNSATASVEVERDAGRIAILLTSPPDKMRTNRPATVVAGQVLSPANAARLTINGVEVPVDPAGVFRKLDFPLVEGDNVITAAVTSKAGQVNSVAVTVTADFTPPVLNVLANGAALTDGARFATAPSLTLEVTDNQPDGVTKKLTVDGELVAEGVTALADGGHALTATARDAAGNETRADRVFFVGNLAGASGCALSNFEPAPDSAVYSEIVRITGRSGGAVGVSINGSAAAVADGSFCGDATLVPGRNEITIRCTDASGQPTNDPAATLVLYRYVDPEIAIASPADGSTQTAATITVTGTVGAGVTSGDVNGIPFTVPDDGAASHTFTVPDVPLSNGLNVIIARARTKSSRIAATTTRVTLLSGAPQITITSPFAGTETGSAAIDVSGVYANVDPSTIAVSAGGATYPATATRLTDTSGTFVASNVPLAPGIASTIGVSGRNAAGVPASASVEVRHVATAPSVAIVSPADNTVLPSTHSGTVTVSGTFGGEGGPVVTVNGVTATMTEGTFSADVTLTASTSGITPIVVRASTPDGRTATDSIRVTRFAAPLAVRESFPANDAAGVDPGIALVTLFTNPLDGASASSAIRVTDAAGAIVSGAAFVDRDAITFAPAQPLRNGARYTVTIAQTLKDASGAPLPSAHSFAFNVASTAPSTAPIVDETTTTGCFSGTTITGRASTPGARVRLDVDGVTTTTVSSDTGAFRFTFTFSGQSGYHLVRVRELGSDGTLSPERALCFRINCAVPQVLAASLDRNASTIAIQFSKAMDLASLVASPDGTILVVPEGETALSGTVSLNATGDTATIALASVPDKDIALTVLKSVKDATGTPMPADYTQTFAFSDDPTLGLGDGYVNGAVYDATNGRPLAGAAVEIVGVATKTTNPRGRYSHPMREGAYTIHASAPGYTTVWRQIVVPAGAGVVPIDIRLTAAGPSATANATPVTLTHGGDTAVTNKVELQLAAASLNAGQKVRLTSAGGQSLAGLLPLGWSPLASAEIAVDESPAPVAMPGAKLTFFIDAAAVASANQSLALVHYDSARDEWRTVVAVANVNSDACTEQSGCGRVSFDIASSGNYALVYADREPLAAPPAARAGAALTGVTNVCATTPDVCQLTGQSFTLDPPQVLPSGRTVATLVTDGAKPYPSGTAVQAFIDEQLNLADGRVLVDPPFATDLLIYRTLDGSAGSADFHLAPSPQAVGVILRDGVDRIRIVDYPGRIDRGTLLGAGGGRVPGDDRITLDVAAGATLEPLHASVASMSDDELTAFGAIPGFRIAGGFTFVMTPATESELPEGVTASATTLLIPARATVSVPSTLATPASQVVIAEVLPSTPYGIMTRVVARTSAADAFADVQRFTTRTIDSTDLPLDGIVREGQYLILVADAPIAYAYGQLRLPNGVAAANARITSGIGEPLTNVLGVRDLTRIDGVFVVPVVATPASPFSLIPRAPSTGDGGVWQAGTSPDPDAPVNVGILTLSAQPPKLTSVSPANGAEVDVTTPLLAQATFDVAIDPASIAGAIQITNLTTSTPLPGNATLSGARTIQFTPAEPLRAASRYSMTIAPTVRATNGALFGTTAVSHFTTRAISSNTAIDRDRIQITIPDANGKSTISGRPGALPGGAMAVAIRRGRLFIESYTATAAADGSFSFAIGHLHALDRVSTNDTIDIQVLDPVSRAIIAIIELTPFVSADGRGFLAPVTDKTIRFTSADGITVVVPGGAFEQPTMVRVAQSDAAPFTAVRKFDQELAFAAGTRIEFDGVAKQRLEIEIPVPAGFVVPEKELLLGWLGESIRGPRVMIVDTIRVADGKFTTTEEPSSGALQISTNQVLTGRDVKKYLLGVLRSGIYSVVNITVPIPSGWAVMAGLQAGYDLFWSHFESLYAADFYMVEGRGRVAVPVLLDTPFHVEGVDSATGFTMFRKEFPNADAGVIENVNPDVTGPYPVFVAPGRVESVDVDIDEIRIRNFELKRVGTSVAIGFNPNETADQRLPEGVKVQALNPARGAMTDVLSVMPDGSFNLGALPVEDGDRVILIAGEKEIAADTEVTVVFNEPIAIPATVDELRALIKLDAYTDTGKIELSQHAAYDVDSNGRRFRLAIPSGHLIRGARYELTLDRTLTDLAGNVLGQGVQVASPGSTTGPTTVTPNRDVVVSFHIRDPHPKLGEFEIEPSDLYTGGVVRDMTQYGNLLFVSALDGGILAYDLADPASLRTQGGAQPKPFAFVPAHWPDLTPGLEHHWAIASDHHGRVYSTGFSYTFGVVRSYRAEDFVKARTSPMCEAATASLPNALCSMRGSAIVGWRPGYSSSLSLSSGTILSDRVEAIPRKMQLLVQDDKENYATRDIFKLAYGDEATVTWASDGFEKLDVKFTFNPDTSAPYYLSQRITVENVTRNMRWSADVPIGSGEFVRGIIASKNDQIRVHRNLKTYAVISQFGHGVGVFDLNAIDSNDAAVKPADWKALREQIIATKADAESACTPISTANGITDLAYSPEAAVVPSDSPGRLIAFAPEVRKGVLGVGVSLTDAIEDAGTTRECVFRDSGLVVADIARLEPVKAKFSEAGRTPVARYLSASYYRGEIFGEPIDYVLAAGNDYGLLALHVGPEPSPYLSDGQLAGVIWLPHGAVAVRTIPRSHLATVVDKRGYVYIVDLSRIDERWDADGNPTSGMFPTTAVALNAASSSPGGIGVEDSRVVWRSTEPLVKGTLPPLFDPDTGFLIAGDVVGKAMRVVPAIDPRVRMMINRGDRLVEVDGITPLGIAPREGFIDTTNPDASAAAFRLEVTLPAGVAKALQDAGRSLQLAIESEFVPTFDTAQTPVSLPKAHLRSKKRNGDPDLRPTSVVLRPDVPPALAAEVRLQKGATKYVSDWIVAIADPRASEKWKWSAGADKPAAGCASCDRPEVLRNKTENEGVYELWSAGRFIAVRPDGALADNILIGTPYEYLGREGRLETRFTTIRGRKVRPTEVLVAAHNPPVADGMIQETHYIHSGEVETAAADLDAGGRAGVNVMIARTYRSRTIGGTEIGEGWDSAIYRFLLQHPNGDVEYHDGAGEIWKFTVDGNGAYVAPRGLFLRLIRTQRGWTMLDQQWRIAEFNDRGQLVRESDEFYDAARPGSGNTIRYVYDERGRLDRILDPLGRATVLEYHDSGRLKEAKTEWRKRSVAYEQDDHGRLESVKLPGFAAGPGVPSEYNHTGNDRPVIEYRYPPATPPAPNEPLQSQAYTDFAELSANLVGIRDPEQVSVGGPERVTFAYDLTAGPNRDRNMSQRWATGEEPTFTPTSNRDALGQERSYVLTGTNEFDGRRHIRTKTLHDVRLIRVAESILPETDVHPNENGEIVPQLVSELDYDEHGLQKRQVLPNGLTVENTWVNAAGAPGKVLQSTLEKAPTGAVIETKYSFDDRDLATANVSGVGRRSSLSGSFTFRNNQTPSRNRQTIESHDVGVISRMTYDDNGQVSRAASADSSGGGGMEAEITYYPDSTTNPIESGRPHIIRRGGGAIVFESTYSLGSNGEEVEETRDLIRGVVTTIRKDVEGRVVSREVVAPSALAGVTVTSELFGYNADGRVAWHSRKQAQLPGDVVTTSRYDALGRITGTTTTGGRVLLDPSVPGGDDYRTLDTRTEYNLATRQIVDVDAHITGEHSIAPRTVKKLDGLGRTVETQRIAGATLSGVPGGSITTASLHDIHGQLAYTTDRKRAAAITQHDHFGRPVATLLADGTRAHVAFSEWDEVIETVGFAARSAPGEPLVETARSRSVYTDQGRLRLSLEKIETAGRSRATGFTWLHGDTITTNRVGEIDFTAADFDATTPVRVARTTRDAAGRVVSEIVGAAEGPSELVEAANIFAESRVTDYFGDLARKLETREPRAGRKVKSEIDYDGLGRPVETREGGGAYVTKMTYDEAGNVLTAKTPGPQGVASMSYDARGLMWREELPTGDVIRRVYDARGTLRQYVDEENPVNPTHYDADALGRIWRIRYPDGTHEESRFEDGTGVLLASRDRAGQWVWFEYDDANNGRLIAEHLGGTGDEPVYAGDAFTRYDYDAAGRVVRIANAESALEFDDFDLLGRPRITRTVRYKKNGCIPSTTPCGSGLADNPQIAEVYTQAHEWSVFDDERSRWRMPAVGSAVPADSAEADTPWRNWIEELRDGGGNVTRQGESVTRGATATAFLEAAARGMGRLAERKRSVGASGASLVARFGYADDADGSPSASLPALAVAPGPPTGALGRHEVLAGTHRIAGTEITPGANQRIEKIDDLGLPHRESNFGYDDRARLASTVLLRRDGVSANEPRAESDVTPGGFLHERDIAPPRISVSDFAALMTHGTRVVPLTWTASAPTAGGQMTHRAFSSGGTAAGEQSFVWSGGRRSSDGTWTISYDARGRLTAAENAERRIEYDYDPTDRLVGRLALQKDAGGAWTLETRTNVLARDALPAAATFVWDPIVDRLVAVYDSSVVTGTSAPSIETGLVRQYIHGDQAYDDQVEVLVAEQAGLAPQRYLPIIDEAGAGSLQGVADADGNLVERILYADAYGDEPRYLHGAVVERIEAETSGSTRHVRIRFSEPVDATTLAGGLRFAALDDDGNVLSTVTAAPEIEDARVVRWSLGESDWTTFSEGAASIQLAISSSLRFAAWGATPLQRAAEWETLLDRATFSTEYPFIKSLPLADFTTGGVLYDLPDLYLAARAESKSKLLFDFHTLPLRDPATGLTYARARWYDSSTGSFLTPDPMGYADASNLYAYAGNDPVNAFDPTGELSWSDVGNFSLGLAKGAGKGALGLATGAVDAVIGVGKASYYATGALLYATTGGNQYREQSETFHQAIDTIKHVVQNPDVITTAVTTSINNARNTLASGDAAAIGELVGGAAFEIGATLVPGLAVGKLGKAGKLVRATETAGDVAGATRASRGAATVAARADTFADVSAVSRRAAPALKPADEVSGFTRVGPCPVRLMPTCVAAGTLIATPADGATPIEDLRVGDRVATTNVNPGVPDGATTVDAVNWHLLTLRMSNPADADDVYEIRTLRPLAWIIEHDAFTGRTIEFETERSPRDLAYVVSVEKAPRIAPGPGRVVLSTFTHRDQILTIGFEGIDEPLETTPTHHLYSVEAGHWVLTSSLRAGDRVRTSKGEATVITIEHREIARVFDIEVETDHAYFFVASDVLSHNCGRPIDTAKLYEEHVANLYGGRAAFSQRSYRTFLDGSPVKGVGDTVVNRGGRDILVEAKYVDNWAKSIRNPKGAMARGSFDRSRTFAKAERRKVLDQARKASSYFAEVVYHTNSHEFIAYYSRLFKKYGLENVKFTHTPF